MSDLRNPAASHAPLVALVKVSPSDMSDTELADTISKLRALRTTAVTKKAAMSSAPRKSKAKLPFDMGDLLA